MADDATLRRRHSERFRKIGGERYPRRVAEAYEHDLSRAMADSDEQVAATVAAWAGEADYVEILVDQDLRDELENDDA